MNPLTLKKLEQFAIENTELIVGGCRKRISKRNKCEPIKHCNPTSSHNPSFPITPTTPPDVVPPGLLDD